MPNSNGLNEKDFDQNRSTLNRVTLVKEQTKVVDMLVSVAHKYLKIDEMALRGYFLLAIQDWQKHRSIKIGEIRHMIPQARIRYVGEMFQELESILTKLLKKDKDETLIKQAVEESYQSYIKIYANRKINANE